MARMNRNGVPVQRLRQMISVDHRMNERRRIAQHDIVVGPVAGVAVVVSASALAAVAVDRRLELVLGRQVLVGAFVSVQIFFVSATTRTR